MKNVNVKTIGNGIELCETFDSYYGIDTEITPSENFTIKGKLKPIFPARSTYYSYFLSNFYEDRTTTNGCSFWMIQRSTDVWGLGCAMNKQDRYLYESGNTIITITAGDIVEFEMTFGKNQSYCVLYVNDVLRTKQTYPSFSYNPNSIQIGGMCNTDILPSSTVYTSFYYLQFYRDGRLIFNAKPFKKNGTDEHYFVDIISNKVISATVYKQGEVTTLESPQLSDYQTITVTNEEYQAIMPILEEMREKELANDIQKPVVT